jgi:hypothetical protein
VRFLLTTLCNRLARQNHPGKEARRAASIVSDKGRRIQILCPNKAVATARYIGDIYGNKHATEKDLSRAGTKV